MSQNWQIKKLSEICNLITDGVHNSPKYVESGIAMLDSKHIKDDFSIDDQNPTKFISQETDNLLSKRCKPLANDLLISSRGSIGKIAIVKRGQNFNIMGNIILLRVPNDVISKYVAFSLQSKLDEIQAISRGVAQKGLYLNQVRNFKIAFPPLPEQKRIVAVLDEVFEGIDRAIANTEKNLTNSRELFESYLNAIFPQKGDGWKEKRLGEIGGKVFTGPFGSLLHKSDYVYNEIPIVNPANIKDDKIIPNFNKTVSKDIVKRLQAYILKQNDVVVGRRGEIGRCAVVREKQAGWLCGSGSFFIKPFENVDSVFLAHLLRSAVYRNKLESLSTGATMQNLSNQSLSDLVISMPSLDEQNRITNKIDDLRTETQRLESIYRKKIAALKELKQSILQKAFTGELTADTPKAAKEEIAA
jgi:type I restriction enzyme, S subunit